MAAVAAIIKDQAREHGTVITRAVVRAMTAGHAITVSSPGTSRLIAHSCNGSNNNYRMCSVTIARVGATVKAIAPRGRAKER